MRFTIQIVLLLVASTFLDESILAAAKPSRPPPSSRRNVSRPSGGAARASSKRSGTPSRRRYDDYEDDEEEEEEEEFGFPDDDFEEEEEGEFDEEYDEEEEEFSPSRSRRSAPTKRGPPPSRRPPSQSGGRRSSSSSSSSRKKPSSRSRYEEDYEDDYRTSRRTGSGRPQSRRGGPPPSRRGSSRSGRSVVPYSKKQPSGFARSLEAIRNSIPDPSVVKEAAVSSLNVARETTSSLSANLYREIKGLSSSELEQVMLKATRPDDSAVKGKHVERLVGVTYQISAKYDIYDAVLRKLWSKMAEKDWRTTIKALYILHRFSADGAPEHAHALKGRLRELRRTRDPKRKDKYFNSKQLLAGDGKPENVKFRAFMSRYAHYVLLRAQCFGGMFDEISSNPKSAKKDKKSSVTKPITSTSLRVEHLEAAAMLLKAGVACQLKEGEECENTAIAAERVASDLIGLTAAVAMALNRALKDDDLHGADPALIKRWCEFYSEELLPQTRAMVKNTSSKLDAYGLFLPSRMGANVAPDILQRGLRLDEEVDEEGGAAAAVAASSSTKAEGEDAAAAGTQEDDEEEEEEVEAAAAVEDDEQDEGEEIDQPPSKEASKVDVGDEYDEYEYEEEEYYDDEEPF